VSLAYRGTLGPMMSVSSSRNQMANVEYAPCATIIATALKKYVAKTD
jgi:hypothetical protein